VGGKEGGGVCGSSVTFGTTVVVGGTGAVAVWAGVNVSAAVNADVGMPVSVTSGISVPPNGTLVRVVVTNVGEMVLVTSHVEVEVA